jgi:hypothetical protein
MLKSLDKAICPLYFNHPTLGVMCCVTVALIFVFLILTMLDIFLYANKTFLCLFRRKFFAHLKIWLFFTLLLSYNSSLDSLDTNDLSDT